MNLIIRIPLIALSLLSLFIACMGFAIQKLAIYLSKGLLFLTKRIFNGAKIFNQISEGLNNLCWDLDKKLPGGSIVKH